MTVSTTSQEQSVFRQEILGSRRFSNYFWGVITFMGGLGFFLASLSSYFHINLLLVSDTRSIQFIPQGVALGFYGVAGLLVSLYLWLTIYWDVGSGYNEFSKENNRFKIVRFGFPGKNRSIEVESPLEDIQGVRAEIREGLNPKRALYLRVKNRRDIPLTRIGEPISLTALENQGAQLARFLGVSLEGL